MLNYFPTPNFVGTGSQANVVNYFESASATHPRRNDVLRVDTYLTSKLTGYFRYINDHDDHDRALPGRAVLARPRAASWATRASRSGRSSESGPRLFRHRDLSDLADH